ncbi:MAG: hypothetical protein R2726_02755 [Acidimicrobiales bacterium]
MGRPVRSFTVRVVAATALVAAVAGLGLASPAWAADQEIVLNKVVNGTAPGGASYEVQLQCQPTGIISGGFVFSGPGSQTVDATGLTDCTVSEPGSGGASSVAFRCQATGRGQCVSETELKFLPGDGPGAVTITVTNTFTPPPTSPTTASTTTTSSSTTTSTSTTTSSTTTTSSSTTTTAAPATTRPATTPGTAVSTATDEGGSNLTPAIVVAVIAGLGVIGLVAALIVQRRRQAEAAQLEQEGEAYLPGGGDRPDAGPYGPTEPPVDPPAQS